MMFGSFLYNLWAALISFTIYFFTTFQKPYSPLRIIISSFVAAIIGFILMYGIRYVIAYILYTPSKEDEDGQLDTSLQEANQTAAQQSPAKEQSTVEFQDESTEEIAQVVRTMMNSE